MAQETQPVQQVTETTGKVIAFSKEAIAAPTPMWATWAFRAVFILTTAAAFWIAGTGLIASENKVEIMLAFKALDVVVWGIGRFIGVKKEDFGDIVPGSSSK